ncbi:MAG: hypothetical protein KFW21_04690 [Spirochaetota bacterium]|nr:hypothetical protein [Spirochaetota bacterium]
MLDYNLVPKIITDHFDRINLDIRKTPDKSLRFSDQKITPDVVSFIADCIVNFIDSNTNTFTRKNIEENNYFKANLKLIFNKALSYNELDKFISQPLAMLTYSGILSRQRIGKKFHYSIQNNELLEYIALKDSNTYLFLIVYFYKFFIDSNFKGFKIFIEIKDKTNNDYDLLKKNFVKFMVAYTNIGQKGSSNPEIEIYRIFTKIINIFSCYYTTLGSVKGNLSKYNITYRDLMYNELNFRDIASGKEKGMSRQEHAQKKSDEGTTHEYTDNLIQRAIKQIKKIHPYSEVNDKLAGNTEHIHHIFPKSLYPSISYYLENLIGLTSGQHLSKAHINGATRKIDKSYQLTCLYAKCENIFKHPQYYTIPNFIHVINTGLESSDFHTTMNQEDIKTQLRITYQLLA